MFSTQIEALARSREFIIRIIWAANTLSVLILIVLAFALAPGQQPCATGRLESVFIPVSFALAGAAFFLRWFLMSQERVRKSAAESVDLRRLASARGVVNQMLLHRLEEVPDREKFLIKVIFNKFGAVLVSLMLHEAIAIFGLVIALQSGNAGKIIPFAIAALALNILIFPDLRRELERYKDLVLR